LRLIERVGAKDVPRFFVFNKLDRLEGPPDPADLERWSAGQPWAILSARDADAVADLERALLREVRREEGVLTTFVPYAAAGTLALIYGRCRVMESAATGDGLTLTIRGPLAVISHVRRSLEKVNS
jgi:GTP-binding protein HflX